MFVAWSAAAVSFPMGKALAKDSPAAAADAAEPPAPAIQCGYQEDVKQNQARTTPGYDRRMGASGRKDRSQTLTAKRSHRR